MPGRSAPRPRPREPSLLTTVEPPVPRAIPGDDAAPQPRPDAGPSDEDLMIGLAERDVGALETLYDRYSTFIFSVALRILSDRGPAEDIVQEVFLQLWRRPTSYDAAHGRFVPWLASVARNRSIDELRRRSRRMRIEEPGEDAVEALASDDRAADPEREAELGEERAAVRAAMQALPPEQRRVLQLANFGGLTQAESARHTGSPLGTVKTRMRLGMQKLRLLLAETWTLHEGRDGPVRAGGGRP